MALIILNKKQGIAHDLCNFFYGLVINVNYVIRGEKPCDVSRHLQIYVVILYKLRQTSN